MFIGATPYVNDSFLDYTPAITYPHLSQVELRGLCFPKFIAVTATNTAANSLREGYIVTLMLSSVLVWGFMELGAFPFLRMTFTLVVRYL